MPCAIYHQELGINIWHYNWVVIASSDTTAVLPSLNPPCLRAFRGQNYQTDGPSYAFGHSRCIVDKVVIHKLAWIRLAILVNMKMSSPSSFSGSYKQRRMETQALSAETRAGSRLDKAISRMVKKECVTISQRSISELDQSATMG